MPQYGPFGRAAGAGAGATAAQVLYARAIAETTLSGAHQAAATVLTLADAAGIRADMRFGLYRHTSMGGNLEYHDIESVDAAADTVTIASPGLGQAQAAGQACFATPMWGADDAIALPAPASGARYAELDCRLLFDVPNLSGSDASYNGRSIGRFTAPHASSYASLASYGDWWAGGNTEEGLDSYSVGIVHGRYSDTRNIWTLDYELATNRLVLLPADASLVPTTAPRIYQLVVTGRS